MCPVPDGKGIKVIGSEREVKKPLASAK